MNGCKLVVMQVDAPLPRDSWGEAARRSFWKEGVEVLAVAKAHMIVALMEKGKGHEFALNAAAAVTMTAAAAAKLAGATGCVFTERQSAVSGPALVDIGRDLAQRRLPKTLWTSVEFYRGPAAPDGRSTTAAATTGLAAFIGYEAEFTPALLEPFEIFKRMSGFCQYLILNGVIVKDGETIGVSESEQIRVRYAPRGQKSNQPTLFLTLEEAGRAGPTPARGGASQKSFGRRSA